MKLKISHSNYPTFLNRYFWLLATIFLSVSAIGADLSSEAKSKELSQKEIKKESFLEQGNTFYKANRFDKAYAAYKKALSNKENPALAQFNMANCLYQMGQAGRALIMYDQLRKDYPDFIRPYINAGGILFQMDQIGEALVIYHKALELDPKNLTVLKMLGESYLKVAQKAKALEYFDKGWRLEQDNTSWLYAMTDVYLSLEDFASARDVLAEAVKRSEKPELWFYKGEMEASLKDLSHAVQSFSRGLELDPKNGTQWLRLANLQKEAGSGMLAILALKEGIQKGALGVDGQLELGQTYLDMGDVMSALQSVEEVNLKSTIATNGQSGARSLLLKIIRKVGTDKNAYLLKQAELKAKKLYPQDSEIQEMMDYFHQS